MGKKTFLIALIFSMLFSFNLFAQDSIQSDSTDDKSYEVVDESSIVLKSSDTTETETTQSTTGSTVWLFVRMIFFLALVVAAIYGVMWFFKKKTDVTKTEDDFLRRVAYLNLGPDKTVEVVTLIDRAFLIGVTDGGISLISEIDDKELIEAMNLNADKKNNTKKPMNFSDVLDMFTAAAKTKPGQAFGNSENKLTETLKKQRNSFNHQDKI